MLITYRKRIHDNQTTIEALTRYFISFGGGGGVREATATIPNLGPAYNHFIHGATDTPVLDFGHIRVSMDCNLPLDNLSSMY